MAHDKLEEQLPKLIPTILSLYKKIPEHYIISKVEVHPRLSPLDDMLLAFWASLCVNDKLVVYCVLSESVPDSRCFCKHGEPGAGDSAGQPAPGSAPAGGVNSTDHIRPLPVTAPPHPLAVCVPSYTTAGFQGCVTALGCQSDCYVLFFWDFKLIYIANHCLCATLYCLSCNITIWFTIWISFNIAISKCWHRLRMCIVSKQGIRCSLIRFLSMVLEMWE